MCCEVKVDLECLELRENTHLLCGGNSCRQAAARLQGAAAPAAPAAAAPPSVAAAAPAAAAAASSQQAVLTLRRRGRRAVEGWPSKTELDCESEAATAAAATAAAATAAAAKIEARTSAMASLLLNVPITSDRSQQQQQQQQGARGARSPFCGVLQQGPGSGVYVQPGSAAVETAAAPVLLQELQRLRGSQWLDDAVINAFLKQQQLLNANRHKQSPTSVPSVCILNTFFFAMLQSGLADVARVQRWTRGTDIFSFRFLLVPLHLHTVHWALGVADLARGLTFVFDALPQQFKPFHEVIKLFLTECWEAKRPAVPSPEWQAALPCEFSYEVPREEKRSFQQQQQQQQQQQAARDERGGRSPHTYVKSSGLPQLRAHDAHASSSSNSNTISCCSSSSNSSGRCGSFWVPPQKGSDDCGVFLCLFVAAICNGRPFCFSQQDIAACRLRLKQRLLQQLLQQLQQLLQQQQQLLQQQQQMQQQQPQPQWVPLPKAERSSL
ncbi:hypothetical protein, conserved [Eimeria tenella]|uniref:Ubiquitin-like protease family profile domain-containing protein n=1 Tax=Eimeria tenella TaxID=5802 RepID=U6KU21_EIMTE|nr:hypothetical protein, conserved [Eimeria tenella]CDJ41642.1 hypothetical protein, conserved [Eimeria tenella]|eukprot:XP_013232392.1 hypothetical protein, conserved [Eimeria tenella]